MTMTIGTLIKALEDAGREIGLDAPILTDMSFFDNGVDEFVPATAAFSIFHEEDGISARLILNLIDEDE